MQKKLGVFLMHVKDGAVREQHVCMPVHKQALAADSNLQVAKKIYGTRVANGICLEFPEYPKAVTRAGAVNSPGRSLK